MMFSRACFVAIVGAMGLACQAAPRAQAAAAPRVPIAAPAAPTSALPAPQPDAEEIALDHIFAAFRGGDRPGCVVGVARDGRALLTKAYGLANLDDGTPNTPDSILEAASVSKQFTASAIVLLARQGKLSLDDDVRKYLPELPVYERPITLRRMLNHTSGLRDWGDIEDVAGWPRGTRNYTQASVLDVMRRQRALNFAPGDEWSYSNSNYNLAAIVVARVSGLSFADFTRQAIFAPLGMTHTRWRDDYTRVVPGRSTAYSLGKDHAWHVDMPIENAIGNGGLLTTVGDLLRWNSNFAHPVVGDAAFVATLETPGSLEVGRTTRYGLGLWLDTMNGARSMSHDGATAGYRSYLDRFPDHGLSIAILCNAGSAQTSELDLALAKAFLPPQTKSPETPPPVSTCNAPAPAAIAGLYRSERTGGPVTVTSDGAGVRLDGARADFENVHLTFCAESETTLTTKRGSRLEIVGRPGKGGGASQRLRLTPRAGGVADFARVAAWQPDARALEAFQGEYWSDEAAGRFSACVRDGKLVLLQGPERVIALEPSYPDVFTSSDPKWVISFRRAGGQVRGLDIGSERMWKLPLMRTGAGMCAR